MKNFVPEVNSEPMTLKLLFIENILSQAWKSFCPRDRILSNPGMENFPNQG